MERMKAISLGKVSLLFREKSEVDFLRRGLILFGIISINLLI